MTRMMAMTISTLTTPPIFEDDNMTMMTGMIKERMMMKRIMTRIMTRMIMKSMIMTRMMMITTRTLTTPPTYVINQ